MVTIFSPIYANKKKAGLQLATGRGDGYSVELKYLQAYAFPPDFALAYNIYFSTEQDEVFKEGVKFVVIDPTQVTAILKGFRPGDVVYFAVRATEFPSADVRLSALPEIDGCRIYPEAALTSDITATDIRIPVEDIQLFPPLGIVQIGVELIRYTSVDIPAGELVLFSVDDRGYFNTPASLHTVDGYDGTVVQPNPLVRHFIGFEDRNILVQLVHIRFQFPNYPRTDNDGYKDKVDIVKGTDNLQIVEENNDDLLEWDFTGWRRDSPLEIVSGKCIGTYIGGEYFCADGYNGVGRQIRGIPLPDANNQRLQLQLETTGDPVVLLRRQTQGKVSFHYYNTLENTAYRGLDNSGTDLVHGYEQFFNPRRSDGKILVRFDPTREDIKREQMGLENEFVPNCYTLAYPVLKDGDVIVRFNVDGTEEWRYEIINVERNKLTRVGDDTTPAATSGAQKFTAIRIRKTDPIYSIGVFCDRSTMPSRATTSVGSVSGPGGIPPHVHEVIISEVTTMPNQINQFTSISQGHNHEVVNGIVKPVLGHTHDLIF